MSEFNAMQKPGDPGNIFNKTAGKKGRI